VEIFKGEIIGQVRIYGAYALKAHIEVGIYILFLYGGARIGPRR
jgi:hypothetical protein